MRHQQHFNATLESLQSIEVLSQQYEQGLQDVDLLASLESMLEQGDESKCGELYRLGERYSAVTFVSMEADGAVDRLKKLLAWVRDLAKKIWNYIVEIFTKLMAAISRRTQFLRQRLNALKSKLETSEEKEISIEVNAWLAEKMKERANPRHELLRDLAVETEHLAGLVANGAGRTELVEGCRKHWAKLGPLYGSTLDFQHELSKTEKHSRSDVLDTYRRMINDAMIQDAKDKDNNTLTNRITRHELTMLIIRMNRDLDEIDDRTEKLGGIFKRASKKVDSLLVHVDKKINGTDPGTAAQDARLAAHMQGINKASAKATVDSTKEETSAIGSLLSTVFGAIDDAGTAAGGL